jgi:4-hydroxy-tetrahydrodipicolinate reductase
MNIGLAGYGKMGHEVEIAARERGHKISLIIDVDNVDRLNDGALAGTDVVIEFTVPGAAPELISRILRSGKPVVSGTTGWLSRYEEIAALAVSNNTSFIHSSNYSPGVYILSRLNSLLAAYMLLVPGYKVSIEEVHHTAKLDSPSGTAIMLADKIINNNDNYSGWSQNAHDKEGIIPIKSVRAGFVPGTHFIKWSSQNDSITLTHEAFSRHGFASGAVIAAEYISGRKGVFNIREIFGF